MPPKADRPAVSGICLLKNFLWYIFPFIDIILDIYVPLQSGLSKNYKTKFKDFLSTFHGITNDF